jgi:hypothetical protein
MAARIALSLMGAGVSQGTGKHIRTLPNEWGQFVQNLDGLPGERNNVLSFGLSDDVERDNLEAVGHIAEASLLLSLAMLPRIDAIGEQLASPLTALPSILRTLLNYLKCVIGGAERDRTADLLVANEALSQLSYSPPPYPYRTFVYQRSQVSDLSLIASSRRLLQVYQHAAAPPSLPAAQS